MSTPNIGERGIRRRRRSGWISFGIALAIAVLLLAVEAPRSWRIVVFAPLVSAGIGWFQAKEKT